jgi:Holliday junction DNA helicase RuvB
MQSAGIQAQFKSLHGATIRTVKDMADVVLNIHSGDVLFIDEIHSIGSLKAVEVLYTALEDAHVDIIFGDASTRIPIRWKLPKSKFTVVGATTRLAKVPQPMLDRFGVSNTIALEFYSNEDLTTILETDADKLGITASSGSIQAIAQRGRGTPRIAIDLLMATRDYASANDVDFDAETVSACMDTLGVDQLGLTLTDDKYMRVLANNFKFEPAGVNAIASVMNIEESTLHSVVEPWLLRQAFIRRTPRGRKLTLNGIAHLKLTPPEGYEG